MEQEKKPGHLVISLDFELFWGMADKMTLALYGPNVLGVRTALPRILDTFTKYGIRATWGTVGMLMARSKEELVAHFPREELRPTYDDERMSSYHYFETEKIGTDEASDPYHFGSSLVKKILETGGQEFANHTFSHYYAIDGTKNSKAIFRADLDAHAALSKTYGATTKSIIFPRNQATDDALEVCAENGLTAYRGNEDHFLYRARKENEQSYFIRGLRLLDHYMNISGHHTYNVEKMEHGKYGILNIPSSRFLRPFMTKLAFLEPLRLRRIKNSMTHAAKRGEVFHLWWHPHNFGINQEQNFKNLEKILEHYLYLKNTYGMRSSNMRDITELIKKSQ